MEPGAGSSQAEGRAPAGVSQVSEWRVVELQVALHVEVALAGYLR